MNLSLVEYQPQKVLAAFRQGEFDHLEVIGQADERDFFHRCFEEHLLEKLAAGMPTARKKEEVPRWFILAANLSLKLHQENSFLAFERVVVEKDFSFDFHFPDGAEYLITTTAETPGRAAERAEQKVSVSGVEPSFTTQLPSLALFLAVIALGMGTGRASKRF